MPAGAHTQFGSPNGQTAPGVQHIGAAQNTPGTGPPDGATAATMNDRIFLRKAAEGGMAEVKFGELAKAKGTEEGVRRFGEKMVHDHAQLDAGLQPFMQQYGIPAPQHLSKDAQTEYDKLNGLSGNDFDFAYLGYMREDHHKDLRAFRQEVAGTQNPQLKQAVESGEKMIAEHTRLVDTLAAANNVPNTSK
jgi:putative membrane protein